MAHGSNDELPLSARRQKPFEISSTMSYSVVLVITSVQPERRNSRWCSTLKDNRIYDFMIEATSAEPSTVEIDGTMENIRAHTRIGYRQNAAARDPADSKPALIHVRSLAQMAYDSIHILNCPLETSNRNLDIARITGTV